MTLTHLRAVALAILLAALCPTGAGAAPQTVISMDYCADQYVLALADRDQVMALSNEAQDGHSFYRERARGLPQFSGAIDELLFKAPDVVVQTWQSHAGLEGLAARSHMTLVTTRYGSAPQVIAANLVRVGEAMGQPARAAALVKDLAVRLKRLRALPPVRLEAAYVTPSGVTSGTGTSVDAMIRLAGFRSYAEVRGLRGWQPLPLEDLVLDPPDLFVTSFFTSHLATQSHWSLARHGRLRDMLAAIPTLDLPGRYLACDGLFLVDAAERLRAGAEQEGIQ